MVVISGSAFIGTLVLVGCGVLILQKVNHGKLWGGIDPFTNGTNQGNQAQDNIFGVQIGGEMPQTVIWFLVILMISIFIYCFHSCLPSIRQCANYKKEIEEMIENNKKEDTEQENIELNLDPKTAW